MRSEPWSPAIRSRATSGRPATTVQTCVIHLIRNTFRLSSCQHWDGLKHDLKPIYTAPNRDGSAGSLRRSRRALGQAVSGDHPTVDQCLAGWGSRPARSARGIIPFLDYDIEIRRVLCSTNAIESLNARYRRAVKARGHFPTEAAALKCLYVVTRSLDPTGKGQARWIVRWKPALNAFAITFADRWPGSETY